MTPSSPRSEARAELTSGIRDTFLPLLGSYRRVDVSSPPSYTEDAPRKLVWTGVGGGGQLYKEALGKSPMFYGSGEKGVVTTGGKR